VHPASASESNPGRTAHHAASSAAGTAVQALLLLLRRAAIPLPLGAGCWIGAAWLWPGELLSLLCWRSYLAQHSSAHPSCGDHLCAASAATAASASPQRIATPARMRAAAIPATASSSMSGGRRDTVLAKAAAAAGRGWWYRARRFRYQRHWGFTTPDLMELLGAALFPLADSVKDWWWTLYYLESNDFVCLVADFEEQWFSGSPSPEFVRRVSRMDLETLSQCMWEMSWFDAQQDGHIYFAVSLAVLLMCGLVSGLELARSQLVATMHMPGCQAWLLCMLIGILGMTTAVSAILVIRAGDTADGLASVQRFNAIELIWETLPQSFIQTGYLFGRGNFEFDFRCSYSFSADSLLQKQTEFRAVLIQSECGDDASDACRIGVLRTLPVVAEDSFWTTSSKTLCEARTDSAGFLWWAKDSSRCAWDNATAHTNPTQACTANRSALSGNFWRVASIFFGFLAAGYSMFSSEVYTRMELHMALTSRHGVIKILANACQTASMIFLLGLIGEQEGDHETFRNVLMFIGLFMLIVYHLFKLGHGNGWLAHKFGCAFDVSYREQWLFALFVAYMGSGAVIVVLMRADNIVVLMREDTPSHTTELEKDGGKDALLRMLLPVVTCAGVFTTLGWLFDPKSGRRPFREYTYDEQVALDAQGMTAAEVLNAKAAAIWRWTDVFADGLLEQVEIERLGDEVEAQTAGNVTLRGVIRQASTLDEKAFVEVCRNNPEQSAAWFAALRLPLLPKEGCTASLHKTLCCDDAQALNLHRAERRLQQAGAAHIVHGVVHWRAFTAAAHRVPAQCPPLPPRVTRRVPAELPSLPPKERP
jgi:hypothetical protein